MFLLEQKAGKAIWTVLILVSSAKKNLNASTEPHRKLIPELRATQILCSPNAWEVYVVPERRGKKKVNLMCMSVWIMGFVFLLAVSGFVSLRRGLEKRMSHGGIAEEVWKKFDKQRELTRRCLELDTDNIATTFSDKMHLMQTHIEQPSCHFDEDFESKLGGFWTCEKLTTMNIAGW